MSRSNEKLDVWLLKKNTTYPLSQNTILDSFFKPHEQHLEKVVEYEAAKVQGVHLPAIDASEQEKILKIIKAAGPYEIKVEEIQPEDDRQMAYTLITVLDQLGGDSLTTLRNILILAQQISHNTRPHLPREQNS